MLNYTKLLYIMHEEQELITSIQKTVTSGVPAARALKETSERNTKYQNISDCHFFYLSSEQEKYETQKRYVFFVHFL